MKLVDLRKFVAIVEAGGMTQAAHRLGVTQPALSRTVRDLEVRMQAQLLRRTGRGIELTRAGDEFFAFANHTLSSFDETKRRVMKVSENVPKRLSLSVPLRVGRLLIPELHREFAKRMPETTLTFFEESSDRNCELLGEHRLDAAIVYATPEAPWPDVVPLFGETLYAVGSADVLEPADHPLTLAELASLSLLIPSRGSYRALIDDSFAQADLEPIVARELETADALLAFAAERDGVAILPYSNIYQECARAEVIARPIVDPEISRTLALASARALSSGVVRIVAASTRAAMTRVAHLARWRKQAARGHGDPLRKTHLGSS
ncbi:MAG: LysR family transcriptional regulator [Pseudomonadota bacterium]